MTKFKIDGYTSETIVSADELARILNTSTGVLAKWRCVGRGPRIVEDTRPVQYRIADVEHWFNTAQPWTRPSTRASRAA